MIHWRRINPNADLPGNYLADEAVWQLYSPHRVVLMGDVVRLHLGVEPWIPEDAMGLLLPHPGLDWQGVSIVNSAPIMSKKVGHTGFEFVLLLRHAWYDRTRNNEVMIAPGQPVALLAEVPLMRG